MCTRKRIAAFMVGLAQFLAACADAPETHTPTRHAGCSDGVADIVDGGLSRGCWEPDEVEPIHPENPPCAPGAPHWRCTDEAFDAGFGYLENIGIPEATCRRVDESSAPWVCCSR